MVVIADDLTGAADCAASSAALGYRAAVLLRSPQSQDSEPWPDAEILSLDVDSRRLPRKQASELIARTIRQCDAHNPDRGGYVLYKKIDSTLRGNVASEMAALLRTRRSSSIAGTRLSLLMAPSLPAQGRTTVNGRLLVHGVPLEQTDIWNAETRPAESNLSHLLAEADLSCSLIDIKSVRGSAGCLREAILQTAALYDVVLCDAQTDSDLRAIAEASLAEPMITAFVGSAGLAWEIPHALGIAPAMVTREERFCSGPTLFVVGSAATVSLQQAQMLQQNPEVVTIHATPIIKDDLTEMQAKMLYAFESGHDVLLIVNAGEHCSSADLPGSHSELSNLISNCTHFLGALVATGGETARAVLDALGIQTLHLLGEVETGIPFSVADSWLRPLPVITKAGAFGSPQALVRCRNFLQKLERIPARSFATEPLHHHEG